MRLIESAKSRVSILDVIGRHIKLKRLKDRYVGCCCFHEENTPSFSVNPSKGFYFCFGCGAKGDVISFIMEYDGIDFTDALKKLAELANISKPKPKASDRVRQLQKQGKAVEALKLAEQERKLSNENHSRRHQERY